MCLDQIMPKAAPYETLAKVEPRGEVRILGVPFQPGTEVEVTIREKPPTSSPAGADNRAMRLFAALDLARNTQSVGPLRREELYDRKVLR